MNWFKFSKNDKIINKIKEILKKHPFTKTLCDYYKIPISEIDNNMDVEIAELGGPFAEGNGKRIRIDPKIMKKDFFEKNFHFIIHEFFHWIKRRSEDDFYLNDPEEVQSFVLQIVWKMINGDSEQDIKDNIFPIIQTHYKKNNKKAIEVFSKMLEQSKTIYRYYVEKNNIK